MLRTTIHHLNTASPYQFNRKRSVCIFDGIENSGFLNTPVHRNTLILHKPTELQYLVDTGDKEKLSQILY